MAAGLGVRAGALVALAAVVGVAAASALLGLARPLLRAGLAGASTSRCAVTGAATAGADVAAVVDAAGLAALRRERFSGAAGAAGDAETSLVATAGLRSVSLVWPRVRRVALAGAAAGLADVRGAGAVLRTAASAAAPAGCARVRPLLLAPRPRGVLAATLAAALPRGMPTACASKPSALAWASIGP
ncbi:hypothetical protein [Ideonella paludis]|uniref:hypothetical protein n=1 Tax=Ideonella paludis TaxID=1233411 RepID=UPI003634F80B